MNRQFKLIYKGILCSAFALTITSCGDSFFDLDNPNQVSNESFWKTEDDAVMALTSCYDALQNGDLYDDYCDGWKYGFLMRETCTDNGGHTWGTWMLGTNIAMGTSSTQEECFSKYWNANYELIKRCNLLLSKVDDIPIEESAKNNIKAEAIALRALGYCNLTSVFRDVPYLTKPLVLDDPEAPKVEKKLIVDSVLTDLKAYNDYLPEKGNEATGRMTREAAYAIMGRLALFDGRWTDAVEAYNHVIGKVKLFVSGDGSDYAANFADLFTEANENADEVLLSVHYKGPGLGEGSTFGVCWQAPMNAIEATMNLCNEYYCTDGLPIDKSPLFKGALTKEAYAAAKPDLPRFENRDPRMKGTLMVPGMDWNGKVYTSDLPAYSTICIRKWFTPTDTSNEYDGSLDYYIIRYAEVLLSMAEAKNEAGGYSQADITKYVNEVRQRVGMPKVEDVEGTNLTQEQLRQIIRHERRVELAFEDLRFADLYRWGEWKNSIQRINDEQEFYGYNLYSHQYRGPQDDVWPIPQSEIDTNSKLVQHDEWK